MNACGFRSMSVTILLLAASFVIIAAASASCFQGPANRELTIAIVDTQRTTPARNAFRAEIAGILKNVLSEACGADVAVHPVFVGGRDARLKLSQGRYDAALVIGDDRPFTLRKMELLTLAGTMPASNGTQPVSLIVGNVDAALVQKMRAAFVRMVTPRLTPLVARPDANLAAIGG